MFPFTNVAALILLNAILCINAAPKPQQVSTSVCLTCTVQCPTCQGQWGEWGPWSDCTYQYGVWGMTRERTCLGTNCEGARDEAIQCTPPTTTTLAPPVWSNWGSWGSCSASCGGGIQSRTRQCIKVTGQTMDCAGASTEQRNCNPQPCCKWSEWSAWSGCSVTCGEGLSVRHRQCSCSQGCQGESMQQQTCSSPSCQPACDPGCGTGCCTISISCSSCLPSQPCASTCYPSSSSSVPIIGADNVPVIGSTVPTIPTISSSSLPVIGSSNIPQITARSVPDIAQENSDSEVALISSVPQISNGNIPTIGGTLSSIGTTSGFTTATNASVPQLSSAAASVNTNNAGLQIGNGASYSEPAQAAYNPYNNIMWNRR
uniref:PSI domain-containing protein n=1 Tax=Syphacia muris TaxID=451379 RepID=A0A0N5AHH2_9BILA